MSKALNKRIEAAFAAIYDRGDAGLEYMDCHSSVDPVLMEHFYNDTVGSLSKADRLRMAEMLEACVADMEFDLETL